MSSAIDFMSEGRRALFEGIVGSHDPDLLAALKTRNDVPRDLRVRVEEVLTAEFTRELNADYEPTERGRKIDNLLGDFLLRWPIEQE